MTRNEVEKAIFRELGPVFLRAFDTDDDAHPARVFLLRHGAALYLDGAADSERFIIHLTQKLTFDACARLPDPSQRNICAIKDAIGLPAMDISAEQMMQMIFTMGAKQ